MTVTVQPLATPFPGRLHGGAAQVRPGTTLAGRFVLHEVLGEGGSGRVFRATHLEVGEEVAVKVLLQEPSPGTLARLAPQVPGAPEFMSAEQLEGKGATPGADVYALGLCVAFAAGASIVGGRVDAVPRAFGAVLERCLRPDPAGRWRDGAALERALRARTRRK